MPAAHVSCIYLTSTIKRAYGTFLCIMSGLGNRLQDYDLHSQWKTDGIDCLPTCHWRVSIGNTTVLAGQMFSAFALRTGAFFNDIIISHKVKATALLRSLLSLKYFSDALERFCRILIRIERRKSEEPFSVLSETGSGARSASTVSCRWRGKKR